MGDQPAEEQSMTFDDDALADALAAEVATYTSPISVIPQLVDEAPSDDFLGQPPSRDPMFPTPPVFVPDPVIPAALEDAAAPEFLPDPPPVTHIQQLPPVFIPDPAPVHFLPVVDFDPPEYDPPERGSPDDTLRTPDVTPRDWPPAYGEALPPPPSQALITATLPTLAPPKVSDIVDLPPPAGAVVAESAPEVAGEAEPFAGPIDLDEDDDAIDPSDRVPSPDPAAAPAPRVDLTSLDPEEFAPVPVEMTPEPPTAASPSPDRGAEPAGIAPVPLDARTGKAVRMFWLWFPANSSIVSIVLGASIFALGMSLRQAIVAALAGVALSFLPLGFGALAGKRSGQPIMVLSRATFGHRGNMAPAILAVLSRLFWAAVLLWVLGSAVGQVLDAARLSGALGALGWTVISVVIGGGLMATVAIYGHALVVRVQMVLAIVTALLIVGVIVITARRVDLAVALQTGDGSWMLVVSGAVLVFSVVGIAWAHSSGDIARHQRPGGSGAGTMLTASFGATLPAFVLVAWGAVLAASSPELARGLVARPVQTLASLLPDWYPVPLIAALALGLLSGAALAAYSGGFAVLSTGLRIPRAQATLIVALVGIAAALGLAFSGADVATVIRDISKTLAVPIAAWVGIFVGELMLRTHPYSAAALQRPGGVYSSYRALNLACFVAFTVIGWGLVAASFPGLEWQGYLFRVFGMSSDDAIVGTGIGVLVALVGALIVTLATARPAIRRQEGRRIGPS